MICPLLKEKNITWRSDFFGCPKVHTFSTGGAKEPFSSPKNVEQRNGGAQRKHGETRLKVFIVCIIAALDEMSMLLSQFQQTKSGIALLYNEETNNTYDVCLKLARDVLTIQKLDVVCTSGTETQVNVSAPEGSALSHWNSRLASPRIRFQCP